MPVYRSPVEKKMLKYYTELAVIEAYKKNKSYKEIQRAFNIKYSCSINRILKKHNIKTREQEMKIKEPLIIEAYKNNKSYKEIIRMFNIKTVHTVQCILRRNNVELRNGKPRVTKQSVDWDKVLNTKK